jgi:hypothetical protein
MYEYYCGWFAHPIFSKEGDYPEIIKKRIAENSKFEGLKQSRLPQLTDAWIDYIRLILYNSYNTRKTYCDLGNNLMI